jgi:ElaB/YqjD/DUF883 family membrane-anchored ribosome-binding protein
MDDELEVIHDEMQQTRSSLAEKLDALEGTVKDTVDDAKSAVSNTVESVKETAASVKDSLNVSRHVEKRPWLMVGGAFAVGYVGGCLIGPSREPSENLTDSSAGMSSSGYVEDEPRSDYAAPPNYAAPGYERAEEKQEEGGVLHEGLQMIKSLAVGSVMGLLRQMAVQSLPSNLVSEVVNVVDDMTTKMGGKRIDFDKAFGNSGETRHDQPHGTEMGGPMGTPRREDETSVGRTYG